MSETLKKIYNTIITIPVHGKENCAKILGICNELEKLIKESETSTEK